MQAQTRTGLALERRHRRKMCGAESSGTNEERAELRVPLKMKTYGGEAECATPHKKNRGQAPIDLPKTMPEEAPRQKLQLSTMPCSFSFPCRKSRIPCWISKRYCKNSLRQLARRCCNGSTDRISIIQPDFRFYICPDDDKTAYVWCSCRIYAVFLLLGQSPVCHCGVFR